MGYPKNPNHHEAIGVGDLTPGLSFMVVKHAEGSREPVVEKVATVKAAPVYEGDGWIGGMIEVEGVERPLDPYGDGIVCSYNGEWSPGVYALKAAVIDQPIG